jgi:hypothetical protein
MQAFRLTFALITILASAGLGAAQEENKVEKPEPPKKPAAKPEPPKDKMVAVGQLEGKLTRVELDKKVIEIEVAIPYLDGRNIRHKHEKQEMTLGEEIQVYWKQPPVETDDKGKPKKSKDIKRPVKGPGGIVGFPTELDTLRKDQLVQVVLSQKKVKPAFGKPKNTAGDENKPVVSAVLIVYEAKK